MKEYWTNWIIDPNGRLTPQKLKEPIYLASITTVLWVRPVHYRYCPSTDELMNRFWIYWNYTSQNASLKRVIGRPFEKQAYKEEFYSTSTKCPLGYTLFLLFSSIWKKGKKTPFFPFFHHKNLCQSCQSFKSGCRQLPWPTQAPQFSLKTILLMLRLSPHRFCENKKTLPRSGSWA